MKRANGLLVLIASAPMLSGCVAAMAASAVGMAARGAQGRPVSNEAFQPRARDACSAQAARYGTVHVIDVEQHSIDKIIVWGTVEGPAGKQSFQCNFVKAITGFELRPIMRFAEPPQAQFKRDLSGLLARVQRDPDYAGVKADGNEMRASIYFKGDAARTLARYTRDPRIRAVSVPVSTSELTDLGKRFVAWLEARGFRGSIDAIDGRNSLVALSVYDPDRVVAAAKKEGLDLTYLRISDAVHHYQPERD